MLSNKDQIKRDLLAILGPDETSSDLITQLATYVVKKMEVVRIEEIDKHVLHLKGFQSEIEKILVDEINLAHTTVSGKTSRLTSAYNRITDLWKE